MVGGGITMNSSPRWLEALLGENEFFSPCSNHGCVKKNEKNIFCLDCCVSICPHCLPPYHRHHRPLQIRRYVYHDVIRLGDAQKLLNCSLVQPYTTNSAKVVFLNQRPMSRPFRGTGNFCITCDRSLQESYRFCSLSCKVHHQTTTKTGLKKRLRQRSHSLSLTRTRKVADAFPDLEDGRLTSPNSVLDTLISPRTSSESTLTATCTSRGGGSTVAVPGGEPEKIIIRKRSEGTVSMAARVASRLRCLPATDIAGFVSRRKGVPHRSPLY